VGIVETLLEGMGITTYDVSYKPIVGQHLCEDCQHEAFSSKGLECSKELRHSKTPEHCEFFEKWKPLTVQTVDAKPESVDHNRTLLVIIEALAKRLELNEKKVEVLQDMIMNQNKVN
jgi:hypothetical protein